MPPTSPTANSKGISLWTVLDSLNTIHKPRLESTISRMISLKTFPLLGLEYFKCAHLLNGAGISTTIYCLVYII